MRPFEHYIMNNEPSLDFYIFNNDQLLYERLSERGENLKKAAKDKFLGKYKDEPKLTLKEITETIQKYTQSIERLEELKAPAVVIEAKKEYILSLEEKIKNKDFIKLTDKESLDYKRAHVALSEAWYQSLEYKQTLKEIYEYNDKEANKLFDISKEEKDEEFIKWLNS